MIVGVGDGTAGAEDGGGRTEVDVVGADGAVVVAGTLSGTVELEADGAAESLDTGFEAVAGVVVCEALCRVCTPTPADEKVKEGSVIPSDAHADTSPAFRGQL